MRIAVTTTTRSNRVRVFSDLSPVAGAASLVLKPPPRLARRGANASNLFGNRRHEPPEVVKPPPVVSTSVMFLNVVCHLPGLRLTADHERHAPRLVELSRSVPPMPTTFKYPSCDLKSHHLQNMCRPKVLLPGPEFGVQVALYPDQQPSKCLAVPGVNAGEHSLLGPLPATHRRALRGPALPL